MSSEHIRVGLKNPTDKNEIVINRHHISVVKSSTYFNNRYRDDKKLDKCAVERIATYNSRTKINNLLSVNDSASGEILPANCRYFHKTANGSTILVMEEAPSIRTIKVKLDLLSEAVELQKVGKLEKYGYVEFLEQSPPGPYEIALSFPYLVYVIDINKDKGVEKFNVYFRVHPLTSLDDYLIRPFLTNMDNSEVCTGNIKLPKTKGRRTLIDITETYITAWWEYEFNTDLSENYNKYAEKGPPELQGYLSWAYFTQYDPMFIFSIDWLMYDYKLSSVIENKLVNRGQSSGEYTFEDLMKMLTTTSSGLPTHDRYTDNIIVKDKILSVGDDVIIDDELLYVLAIDLNNASGEVSAILFEDEKDNEIVKKYNDELSEKIYAHINNISDTFNHGGHEFKVNDVVEVDIHNHDSSMVPQYRIFKGFRKTRDGIVEVRLGKAYHIEESINIRPIDMDKLTIDGVKPQKDVKYLLKRCGSSGFQFTKTFVAEFTEIKVLSSGKIASIFRYTDEYGDRQKISLDMVGTPSYNVLDLPNYSTPEVFIVGRRLYTQNLREPWAFFTNDKRDPIYYNRKIQSHNTKELIEYITTQKDRLYIPGIHENIDFKVGDDIIVANWENPYEMTIIQTIIRFEYKNDRFTGDFHANVVCKDHQGIERWYTIVEISLTGPKVNVGLIRKAYRTYDGIVAGSKIRAKVPRLGMFPKKDVNKIVAFIETGATPLMICSNLCTLWANQETYEKFDIFPPTHPKYYGMKIAPYDTKKIKRQFGDYIYHKEDDRLYYNVMENNQYLRAVRVDPSFSANDELYKGSELENKLVYYGFQLPRITPTVRQTLNYEAQFQTIYGPHIETTTSIVPTSRMIPMPYVNTERNFELELERTENEIIQVTQPTPPTQDIDEVEDEDFPEEESEKTMNDIEQVASGASSPPAPAGRFDRLRERPQMTWTNTATSSDYYREYNQEIMFRRLHEPQAFRSFDNPEQTDEEIEQAQALQEEAPEQSAEEAADEIWEEMEERGEVQAIPAPDRENAEDINENPDREEMEENAAEETTNEMAQDVFEETIVNEDPDIDHVQQVVENDIQISIEDAQQAMHDEMRMRNLES